jgi:hypothetical protein
MIFFKKKAIPLMDFFPEGFVDIHSHLLPGIDLWKILINTI